MIVGCASTGCLQQDGEEEAMVDAAAGEEEERGSKNQAPAIIIASALFIFGIIFERQLHETPYASMEYLVFLAAYLLVGGKIVWTALKNMVQGEIFDENFLMTVATGGAILIHQLAEAAGVMLFFAVGEFFQDMAVKRSRRSISALMDIRPDYANLKSGEEIRRVSPGEVAVGQVIVVNPGERIPLDGVVIQGASFVDTSALTGESVPKKVEAGEKVLSGMVNGSGLLEVKVERCFADSSVSRILDLVERASARKAPTEQVITRFSRLYTPVVTAGAVALAVVPPLVMPGATFKEWIYRALVLLVISCPCALVISIPLGYFGGIGGASRHGILVKGANFLEALTHLHTVVFDKTGTLTKGVFRVSEVATRNGFTREELLRFAALAESHSNHPIAKSIQEAYRGAAGESDETGHGKAETGTNRVQGRVQDYQEIAGHGIKARVDGKVVVAGNDRLMHRENIPHDSCDVEGTVVYVAMDGVFAGYIIISDEIKPDAARAVEGLRRLGVRRIIMLTGDDEGVARMVASRLGMDGYFAELLPEDKVRKLEELESSLARRDGQKLAFVGDGINDAPVITRADVGIAMGGLGSDAAIEAADVVIMEDMPSRLVTAVGVARYTRKIIMENITLALATKGLFIALGAVGVATMWEAVFADVGVALLAILNATRALRYKDR
ncbi:MAG TPA: cadmium-translocating P-type ATPase [Firmicutes bacterium]|nr:cadmium-translocating P-type ATPase [Bacillota bacterium]